MTIYNHYSTGLHIDASSGFEVRRAISAGIPASHISLSTQELPTDFAELLKLGVKINACSLTQVTTSAHIVIQPHITHFLILHVRGTHEQRLVSHIAVFTNRACLYCILPITQQLERIGAELPGHAIGLRVNPGLGSGGSKRTNVGGPSSSFGIWHTQVIVIA
jgi:diaminopimelate decarboxylase